MKFNPLALSLALLCLLFTTGTGQSEPAPVPDGFYAVVRREAGTQTPVPTGENELRLRYHAAFCDAGDPAEDTVVVRPQPFVPLLLKEAPTRTADPTQRTRFWVGVSLTEAAARQFESFTARHLGQSVAIVVGGEVITVHTIRQVIKDGRVQISRCGDEGCQVLFRELTEE